MTDIGHALRTLASANPVVAGLLGAALTGSFFYLVRAVPAACFRALVRALSVQLVVTSDDEVYDWINDWLSTHAYSLRARLLKLSTSRSDGSEWSLAPGFGTHIFWDAGIVVLSRQLDDKANQVAYGRQRERFVVATVGRRQATIRSIIDRAYAKKQSTQALGVRCWANGFWQAVSAKAKRPVSSVFLPAAQKSEMLAHADWFFGARPWFAERGIPYRQGYLLHGAPGTGKTSIAMALAGHFDKPLYVINLASVENDNALMFAFLSTLPSCVVLIEDVDATRTATDRDAEPVPPPEPAKAPSRYPVINGAFQSPPATGVTLSGLLNAIDGVASSEGRLLIMTTNRPDVLDPALLRPGRVDLRFEIGPMDAAQVREMALRFYRDAREADWWADRARSSQARPAAEWQVAMLSHVRAARPGAA